jgi:hypothetical protein
VVGCGWIVTLNDTDTGGVNNGEIGVERASDSNPNRLRIRMYNSAGTQLDPEADDAFTVLVICP